MVAAQYEPWNVVSTELRIQVSLADADVLLASDPDRWLPEGAEAYESERDTMLASVGLGGLLSPVRRRVRVSLGPVTRADGCVRRHLAWEAASQARFFPVMEGTVTVTETGPSDAMLEVRAHYQPPLGKAGRLADRALLHLVAAASIKSFAVEVAAALERLSRTRV